MTTTQISPPCDCGNTEAQWYGEKDSRREYMCANCHSHTGMAGDLESYLERRYERAIDRLDRKYLESDMSEYEYQNEAEMLKVQIFQGMVAVCNFENQ